jgi:hypothetical protein
MMFESRHIGALFVRSILHKSTVVKGEFRKRALFKIVAWIRLQNIVELQVLCLVNVTKGLLSLISEIKRGLWRIPQNLLGNYFPV